MAYDLDLEFLSFPNTGGNITAISTMNATKDNGFTHSYHLAGPSSLQEFSQVLSSVHIFVYIFLSYLILSF